MAAPPSSLHRSGGGITAAGKWKHSRGQGKYLFPKGALSVVFRAKFMAELRKWMDIPQPIAKKVFATKWVVYAKRPFATPKTVVEYLGRYTHKVAISNHRLTAVNADSVSFTYKDYREGGKQKETTLSGIEFLRRFADHILPAGFVRVRHYGFLASRNKPKELNMAKRQLRQPEWHKVKYPWEAIAREKFDFSPARCGGCGKETVAIIKIMGPDRGPPVHKLADV